MITSCDFRFVCPMDWNAMADLPDGSGKHCEHCQRPVITVHNRRQFKAAAKRGDCVAYFPDRGARGVRDDPAHGGCGSNVSCESGEEAGEEGGVSPSVSWLGGIGRAFEKADCSDERRILQNSRPDRDHGN
jgi:hypothetical protein